METSNWTTSNMDSVIISIDIYILSSEQIRWRTKLARDQLFTIRISGISQIISDVLSEVRRTDPEAHERLMV